MFKKKNNLNNLKLYARMNFSKVEKYLLDADVLLISLKAGKTFDFTIPGKFQTYLSYDKFIFGMIGGEVKRIINKYNLGVASDSQNINKLTKILIELISRKKNDKLAVDASNVKIKTLKKIFSLDNSYSKIKKNLSFPSDSVFYELITNPNKIFYKKKYILSAFNLAFLGHFVEKKIPINPNIILWPDGLVCVRFAEKLLKKKVKKIPGSLLMECLNIDKTHIKKIIVLGTMSQKSIFFLKNKFDLAIEHVDLPYGDIKLSQEQIPMDKLNSNTLCLITLPTPKQEMIADFIFKNRPELDIKIICIGGGLSIASGTEKKIPNFLNKFFFGETLWRLRYETKRRLIRLILSSLGYMKGYFNLDLNKIKIFTK
jgi:UDP-N-acetyl-D-mannosaminuronic acid transferase (WecB/TagA/CpsF family)